MSDISQGPGWRSIRRKAAPGKAPSGGPPRTSHVAGRTKRLWRLSGPIGAIVLLSGIIVASPGFSGSASADTTAQTISFAPLADMQFGDAPFTVSATATSGLPVSFSIPGSASGVCTSTGTDGSTITLVGAGTCTVQADQAGDATYAQAPSVQQAFTVSPAPTAQTISFAPLADMQFGDAPFTVSATATSGLPVSFSIPGSASGVCTSTGTDGSTITLVGAGTCTVQADQAGDATYAQAPSVQQAFTVSQATPTVSITNIPSLGSALVGSTFSPSYDYAGDGATSTTSSTPSICAVGGTTVYLEAAGTCTLTAEAAATTDNAAATGAAQSFAITSPTPSSCTKTWASAVSGNWSDASMWSPVGVPSSSDTVCITNDAASYTVTVDTSAVAGSLLVGGTAGTQTLDISAGESLQLYGDSATSPDGTITMEASSTPGASYLYLDGYTLTNAGTLDVPASDGTPAYLYYDGSVVNTGTVEVDGTLNIYGGVTFTNAVGGSVVNNGTFTDGTYVQDGGSNSGTPLSPSTLVLSGGGSASFEAVGMSVQGGPLMAGQSIDIPASGSMYLDNNLTNDGTITMDTSASAYSYLYLEGYTLTNAGTFSVPADGNSGSYAYVYSSGSVDNTGTVEVDGILYITGGVTFTNALGGSVVNNGTFTDGTYVQDGGSNSGTPLSPSTLVLSGGGSASFEAVGMSVQGTLMAGQSIDIPASGSMYLDNNLTNDGTITMDTSASGYSYLYLEGYTLTNAGTFSVPADGNSGSYAYVYSSGSVDNTGTVEVDGILYITGGVTFTNSASVTVGSAGELYGSTFTNSTGGSVVNNGTFTDGTYVQDGGSNSGTPLSPSTLVLSGGGSASFEAVGMSVQGGPLMAGQSIDIPASGSMYLDNNLTNDGTITMDTSASGYSYLYLEGYTLTNAGTFSVPADGNSGSYAYVYSSGSVDNTGTVEVDGILYITGGVTFTNALGGSVVNNGTFTDGTYVQDGGSNSGTPLSPSTLVLSGGGSASFEAVGMSVQGGPLMAGQSIDIPASGSMYLDNNLTNDGTITMDTSASGYSYLYLEGYTLTNAGTFSVPADGNTGSYAYVYSSGSVDNTGTVQVDGILYITGGVTFTNSASVTVGSAGELEGSTFTQDATGVLNVEHDATGTSGTVSASTANLNGCIGTSGPSLPLGTILYALSYSTLSGQFSCSRFPTQIYSVNYETTPEPSVQLVATDVVATPPTIMSADSATFTVGTSSSLTVTTTGTPVPGLSETGALPAGVTFVDNGDGTATLSGMPTAGSGGVYPLTITAANGATPSAVKTFTLTVDEAPSVTSADQATFIQGNGGTFTVTTSGYPAPTLSVSSGLPSGVSFADNGNGTGTLSYTPTAGTGGLYSSLTIKAHNGAGADAEQPFTLDVDIPPTVSVVVTPGATTVGDQVSALITASSPGNDSLSYTVDFGDGTVSSGAYPGTPVTVTHTYTATGPWTVLAEATDSVGATDEASQVVQVDPGQPLSANAGPDQTTTANEPVGQGITLDGSASTPGCCIASYQWVVTNGTDTQDFDTQVVHDVRFTTAGTYTATLTVEQGSDTSSADATITVDPQTATGVSVTVLDDATDAPIDGAQVDVISAAGEQYQASSAANGVALLTGVPDGSYTAYVVEQGYHPNQGSFDVSGGLGSATVDLTAGGLATASVTSTPITNYQTLIADGIDPNDPSNYNIYQFDINLVFDGVPVTFSGFVSQGAVAVAVAAEAAAAVAVAVAAAEASSGVPASAGGPPARVPPARARPRRRATD